MASTSTAEEESGLRIQVAQLEERLEKLERDEPLEKNKERLEKRLETLDQRTKSLRDNLFTLANFHFVLQGVILLAFLKSSAVCNDIWIVTTLSLSAAVINLGAIAITGRTWVITLRHRDQDARECIRVKADLENKDIEHGPEQTDSGRVNTASKRHLSDNYDFIYGAGLFLLILFTGFIVGAAYFKLCVSIHAGKGDHYVRVCKTSK